MVASAVLSLDRVTCQGFAAAWPTTKGEPGAARMNSISTYVASRP